MGIVRYSPAPISIKHLLDHGKASNAKVELCQINYQHYCYVNALPLSTFELTMHITMQTFI